MADVKALTRLILIGLLIAVAYAATFEESKLPICSKFPWLLLLLKVKGQLKVRVTNILSIHFFQQLELQDKDASGAVAGEVTTEAASAVEAGEVTAVGEAVTTAAVTGVAVGEARSN